MNESSQIQDDLNYWGFPPNSNSRNSVRILLFSSNPGPSQAKDITELLVMNRLKYKLAYSGRNLPDLISLSKGLAKYLVIVFQDIRDFYHMDKWNRELLEKYCRQFKVGILSFLPSGDDVASNEALEDSSNNNTSPFSYSSHLTITSPTTGNHKLFRILKPNMTISGIQSGDHWVKFDSLGKGLSTVASATFPGHIDAPIVIEDQGLNDHVRKIVIGGSNAMNQWFIKLLFLDSLNYLSTGEIVLPLTRYILVDIESVHL